MELPNRPTKDPYQELPVKDFSYINTQKNLPNKRRRNTIWIVAGVVVLVLAVGGVIAYSLSSNKPAKHSSSNTNKSQSTTTSKSNSTSSTNSPSGPTTSYTSTTFNVTLSYPSSWSVSAQNNTLSISSPEMALTTADGKSVEGKVVFNIYNQGQLPASFGTSSVAVLDSKVISFSNPTANQAAQTYLSFAQYPATTTKGGLDGVYVTGNNGFLKTDVITATQVNQVSPLIFTDFIVCQNQSCSQTAPLTIASTMWSNSSFSAPIININKSLSFN